MAMGKSIRNAQDSHAGVRIRTHTVTVSSG